MKEYLYLLIFFLCLASSAGSILLTQKMKTIQLANTFDALFYFVILAVFFGFYSIWGQVMVHQVLIYFSASAEIVMAIGHVIPLLGFPFLIMSGYMLLRFGYELWGKKISHLPSVFFYLFYLLLLFVFGWISFYGLKNGNLNFNNPLTLLILFFAIQETVIHGWYLLILASKIRKNRYLSLSSSISVYSLIFLGMFILKFVSTVLVFLNLSWAPLFIMFYFMSIIVPVYYLYTRQRKIVNEVQPDIRIIDTLETILHRNGITRREREIINLICTGKTNQEIADSLFISLQTVKDHTHRIYLKLDVKNRMQLIHLLRP